MSEDQAASERPGAIADTAPRVRARLPLVSVVVVNFNYGRFLAEAVGSVFAQRYPNVECVLVDNASTDESGAVIAACVRAHPALKVLRQDTNEGQTAACVRGLRETRGPYVIFLDADDYLLPDSVATHMAVHLCSRVHVGFTSGDMLQIKNGETVLSTNEAPYTYIVRKRPPDRNLLRPSPAALGDLPFGAADLGDAVYLVPRRQRHWVWAPTSGNCFRRDALDLFCDGDGLESLTSQTDLYLAMGVNAASGSIHIDRPIFAYRLHGANAFSSRPQLQGFLSFDAKRGGPQTIVARRLILDQLTTFAGRFVEQPQRRWAYFLMLWRLDADLDAPAPWRGSYAACATARNFDAVAPAVGRTFATLFLAMIAPWRMKLPCLVGRWRSPVR